MPRRTTIEIDQELLDRAKQALGESTTRATVEEALRRAADSADADRARRAEKQVRYLQRLSTHLDVDVLDSESMWR